MEFVDVGAACIGYSEFNIGATQKARDVAKAVHSCGCLFKPESESKGKYASKRLFEQLLLIKPSPEDVKEVLSIIKAGDPEIHRFNIDRFEAYLHYHC